MLMPLWLAWLCYPQGDSQQESALGQVSVLLLLPEKVQSWGH